MALDDDPLHYWKKFNFIKCEFPIFTITNSLVGQGAWILIGIGSFSTTSTLVTDFVPRIEGNAAGNGLNRARVRELSRDNGENLQLETSRNINLVSAAINLGPFVINGSGRRGSVPAAHGPSIDYFFAVESMRRATDKPTNTKRTRKLPLGITRWLIRNRESIWGRKSS